MSLILENIHIEEVEGYGVTHKQFGRNKIIHLDGWMDRDKSKYGKTLIFRGPG